MSQTMSISNDILQYIGKIDPERLPNLGPQQIASDLGLATEQVTKLLWSLEHTKRIEIRREGRNMVGISRIVRLESAHGGGPRRPSHVAAQRRQEGKNEPSMTVTAIRGIRTPELDEYEQQKAEAARVRQGKWMEVHFRESPLAEEGLRLRSALAAMTEKYKDLSSDYMLLRHQWDQHMDREHHRPLAEKVEQFRREAEGD